MKQDEFIKEFASHFGYTPNFKQVTLYVDDIFNFINHIIEKQSANISDDYIELKAKQWQELTGANDVEYTRYLQGAKWALSLHLLSKQPSGASEEGETCFRQVSVKERLPEWKSNSSNAYAVINKWGAFDYCVLSKNSGFIGTKEPIEYWLEPFKSLSPQSDAVEWISVETKPELNEEYNCAIDLEDGHDNLVVFACEYNIKKDKWYWSGTEEEVQGVVLFWSEKPAPPKIEWEKTNPIYPVLSLDQQERLAFGQCVHGNNLASCSACNDEDTIFYKRKELFTQYLKEK